MPSCDGVFLNSATMAPDLTFEDEQSEAEYCEQQAESQWPYDVSSQGAVACSVLAKHRLQPCPATADTAALPVAALLPALPAPAAHPQLAVPLCFPGSWTVLPFYGGLPSSLLMVHSHAFHPALLQLMLAAMVRLPGWTGTAIKVAARGDPRRATFIWLTCTASTLLPLAGRLASKPFHRR